MNAGFTILIIFGGVIVYSVIFALFSVFIEKHTINIFDEVERSFICLLWPVTIPIFIPIVIIDSIRLKFGLKDNCVCTFNFDKKKKKD